MDGRAKGKEPPIAKKTGKAPGGDSPGTGKNRTGGPATYHF